MTQHFADAPYPPLSLSWNPSVGANCTSLFVNYYYCVVVPTAYTSLPNATTQYSATPGITALPTTGWNLSSFSMGQTTFTGAATACPILLPAPMASSVQKQLVLARHDMEEEEEELTEPCHHIEQRL
jgi:hypothetical protein